MAAVNVVQTFDSLFMSLIDADTSFFFVTQNLELGVSDGTSEGTVILGEQRFAQNYEGSDGRVFFNGFSSASGEEPFVNNGTSEGTTLLLDINPVPNATSNPFFFTSVGDLVYFSARDEEDRVGLYSSDGTPEGTQLVADLNSEIENIETSLSLLTDFNGTLLFALDNENNFNNLWKSNGTNEGTQLIFDFEDTFFLNSFVATNEHLYFNLGDREFWATNGTTEGTQLLLERGADNLTSVGNTLFFTSDLGGTGNELWSSDGTPQGTQLVADILPSEIANGTGAGNSSNPENLTNVNGMLYFTANDGINGTELWSSDGTAEGTQLVADITEGEDSSSLSSFTAADNTLYFLNSVGFSSNQLWQSDGTAEGTFAIEPEQISIGTSTTTPSFGNPEQLIELDGELYFTGEYYDTEAQEYVSALLTVENTNNIDDSIVYRSFNPTVGVHFYTTDVAERDEFLATGNYVDEGASYRAAEASSEGAEEVYRFFNETTGVHLYTTDEVERENIQANLPEFEFEGVVFNAYETQVEGSIPVYRFFEPTIGVHLYTPSEVERESVDANLPNYNFENIAYYALPLEAEV